MEKTILAMIMIFSGGVIIVVRILEIIMAKYDKTYISDGFLGRFTPSGVAACIMGLSFLLSEPQFGIPKQISEPFFQNAGVLLFGFGGIIFSCWRRGIKVPIIGNVSRDVGYLSMIVGLTMVFIFMGMQAGV